MSVRTESLPVAATTVTPLAFNAVTSSARPAGTAHPAKILPCEILTTLMLYLTWLRRIQSKADFTAFKV